MWFLKVILIKYNHVELCSTKYDYKRRISLKKKLLFVVLFLVIIFSIIIVFLKFNKNNNSDKKNSEEIIPEEEISDEQQRKTMITLFFQNIEDGSLETESRTIDVKKLAENPYEEIIKIMMEGTTNKNLKNAIPEGTILNSAILEGDTVLIDLSNEFIENSKDISVDAIEKTLKELNEVNNIKIIFNGKEIWEKGTHPFSHLLKYLYKYKYFLKLLILFKKYSTSFNDLIVFFVLSEKLNFFSLVFEIEWIFRKFISLLNNLWFIIR